METRRPMLEAKIHGLLEAPYPLSITAHVEFDDGPALSLEWPLTFEYCYEDSSSETCDGQ